MALKVAHVSNVKMNGGGNDIILEIVGARIIGK